VITKLLKKMDAEVIANATLDEDMQDKTQDAAAAVMRNAATAAKELEESHRDIDDREQTLSTSSQRNVLRRVLCSLIELTHIT